MNNPIKHYFFYKPFTFSFFITAFLFGVNFENLEAQAIQSAKSNSHLDSATLENLPFTDIQALDLAKISAEDSQNAWRFAAPISTQFTTQNSGTWQTRADGSRVWHLRLRAAQALALSLQFDDLNLPLGVSCHVFSTKNHKKIDIARAFSAQSSAAVKSILLDELAGNTVVVQLVLPKKLIDLTTSGTFFTLSRVFISYKNTFQPIPQTAEQNPPDSFGRASTCHINANCPQGDNFQNQKRGVVRIRVATAEGLGWCSGSLVNNTRQDGTPFLLSAFHCIDGLTPQYAFFTFYFNYEASTCTTPAAEPTLQSLQGCVLRAGQQASDFLLLELTNRVPSAFNPYFNGWSADSTNLPASTAIIHHPWGDLKKISRDNQAAVVAPNPQNWSNGATTPARHHLEVIFDEGGFEPGSSGGPLFDPTGRIIGQIHGGIVNATNPCLVVWAKAGWFAKSWSVGATPTTRLRDWLDPLSTGVLNLAGTNSATTNTVSVSGRVQTWWNAPLRAVRVRIGNDSTETNAEGNFSFSAIPVQTALDVELSRMGAHTDGVDLADMLINRRHILNLVLITEKFKLFAADLNDDGNVDLADMLHRKRLLLGQVSQLPVPAWRFVPMAFADDPNFPSSLVIPRVFQVNFSSSTTVFNFTASKSGDLNGSATTQ
jgi:lysyl endopeptidase